MVVAITYMIIVANIITFTIKRTFFNNNSFLIDNYTYKFLVLKGSLFNL